MRFDQLNQDEQALAQACLAAEQDIITLRRELHAHPELSFQEFETTKKLAKLLQDLGLEVCLYEPTGLSADLCGTAEGAEDGACILLRADMDALEVCEATGLEYSSKHEGLMHACGHDTHVAMLYGAIKALVEHKDKLKGRVRFVFQPAEEIARGALKLIEQGVMEGVDACYGSHIFATQKKGSFDVKAGPRYAAADYCDIYFTGFASHGAQPHLGIDCAVMLAHFVSNIQAVVSRRIDPQHPAVLTVGKMLSGTRFNIVPGSAECSLTVRSFYPEDRELIKSSIEDYAQHIAAMEGGTARIDYTYGTQIVKNHEEMTAGVQRLIAKLAGKEALFDLDATLGGEDFGAYSDMVPGCFVNLGGGFEDSSLNYPNHNEKFTIDESSLVGGSILYSLVAYEYLSGMLMRD